MSKNMIGYDKVMKEIEKISSADVSDAMLAGAMMLQSYSMINAPVKTGNLRASHESRKTVKGAEMTVNADYAVYVEYGTVYMAARSFVRKAIDSNIGEVLTAIYEQAKKALEKAF